MISMVAILLLLLLCSSRTQACSGNQVSRTCECSAVVTAGEYDVVDSSGVSVVVDEAKLKRLFTVKSYDDCGVNLGCEAVKQNDCARYCSNQIVEKLAGASVVNDLAKASLCQLVMGDSPLFENGIRLFASWKYSSCQSGYNVVVKNVCCNRICGCQLLKQSSAGTESLVYSDSVTQKAFQCDKAADDPCLGECRSKMSALLREPSLASSSSVSLNLFANQATADYMCSLLQPDVIASPGVNIVVRVETNRYKYVNYIHLGQLCCYGDQVCSCGLSLRGFNRTSGGAQSLKATIIDYSLPAVNKGYQCASELRNCMKQCRDGMLPPSADSSQMTSDLYPLDTQLAIQVCSSLQTQLFPTVSPADLETTYDNGLDVFVEFNSGKSFPEHEQLFLGRVCCRNSPAGLQPSIRCL